jgi:hypothetical protein
VPKPVQPIPIKFIYEEGSFEAWSKLELVNGTFYETPQFEKVARRRREPSLEAESQFLTSKPSGSTASGEVASQTFQIAEVMPKSKNLPSQKWTKENPKAL